MNNNSNTKNNVMTLISFGLAILSLLFLALAKTIGLFPGVGAIAGIVQGILSILIYTMPIAGMVLSFLTKKKPTFDFYVNAGTLALAFTTLQ